MARIAPLEIDKASIAERRILDSIVEEYGSATNMKRTLARSPVALHALMEWYPLYREAKQILGERLTTLYCYAISTGSDCLLCSTYFRKALIDAGENPEALELHKSEKVVVAYGAQLATDPNAVDDALFARLERYFTPEQIVTLTAFAGLMIATNIFNSALRVDVDQELKPYRLATAASGATGG